VKQIDSNLACPSCHSLLRPKVLACPDCDIKVEGPFQLNEFATLAPDDLHFLRIFVRSEGRIRDMETALGLSYPTIRARLTALKNKLSGETPEDAIGGNAKPSGAEKAEEPQDVGHILQQLQAGAIPFDQAMNQIKRLRAKPR
jgi:hypothetical protein